MSRFKKFRNPVRVPSDVFRMGDRVRLKSSPFKGLTGEVVKVMPRYLRGSVAIKLNADAIVNHGEEKGEPGPALYVTDRCDAIERIPSTEGANQ